jgi:hypothetical protein
MFTGLGRATRDIFAVWLASLFAGAVICTFAKCPKLEPVQPPFIHLPDWYVFEDFCADLCRAPLIEGRIRDYMACVNRCITSVAPRSPAEKVVVVLRDRAMVYIDESIVSADMGAYTTRAKNVPIEAEEIHLVDSTPVAVRNRVQKSVSDGIKTSDVYSCITVTRAIQSLDESTSPYDSARCLTATRVARELSESITSTDSTNTVIPSVISKTVTEGVGSTDKMPVWVPLPPITPYARWIEAVNEYIDPYYGASMVATDILTGEVIRVGEIGRAFHSIDIISDSAQITAKPPIYILPSDTTLGLETDVATYHLLRAVQLATPATPLAGITVPAVSPYLRMLLMSSVKRLSAYMLIPQGIRTKAGVQLTSPIRLSIYASLPQGIRTKAGVQLTSPTRTCAQVTITV